jgi:hypothetical protein
LETKNGKQIEVPQIEKFTNIDVNQFLTIKEGSGIIKKEKPKEGAGLPKK